MECEKLFSKTNIKLKVLKLNKTTSLVIYTFQPLTKGLCLNEERHRVKARKENNIGIVINKRGIWNGKNGQRDFSIFKNQNLDAQVFDYLHQSKTKVKRYLHKDNPLNPIKR